MVRRAAGKPASTKATPATSKTTATKATTATPATSKTSATPATSKTIYHVLPHDGDAGQRWDLHRQGARKHDYFRTQKEALEAAHRLAAGHAAHVVLHARDGHIYREVDLV